MESHYAIQYGTLKSFAEQQLVDCDREKNQGCNGGFMDDAFKYAMKNAIVPESDYPYTARDGTCKKDIVSSKGVDTVADCIDIHQSSNDLT